MDPTKNKMKALHNEIYCSDTVQMRKRLDKNQVCIYKKETVAN